MTIRSLTNSALIISAAAILTACAVDVPTPDDPDAQKWTPKIKAAYRNWQPPMKMPDGNPEYQTALNKTVDTQKQPASVAVTVEDKAVPVPEKKTVVPAKQDVAKVEPVKAEVKAEPVKAEVKAEPVKPVAQAEPVKAEVKAEPVKAEVKAEPVKPVVKAEPVKAEVKAEPVKPVVQAEPVKAEVKAEVKAAPATEQKARKTSSRTKMVIDESATAAEYIVKNGDSLSIIAKAQYKNGNLWYILLKANKDVVKDVNKLKPGMKLSIPVLKSVPVGEK